MAKLVDVSEVAKFFGISERSVQRLVIHDGMPRDKRGGYNLGLCGVWYIRHLHKQVCGCAGPCEGYDAATRNVVNARAERRAALKEILDLTPELVGLDENEIRSRLEQAIKTAIDPNRDYSESVEEKLPELF